MKRILVLAFFLVFGGPALTADVPLITIVAPGNGQPLFKNETEIIRWTHSDYFDSHAQTCRIFCGEHAISPPLAVTADAFSWVAGRKADGTVLPQGIYKITIESPDYDALAGPTVILADEKPKIVITAPASGASLPLGSACTIRWTCSSYFQVVPQTCRIFCGESFISPPVPVLDGEYSWKAGRKDDGTYLAVGTYPITLESDDYDALSGPSVTLTPPEFRAPIRRFMEKVPLHRVPGCPTCFRIDPRELKIDPQSVSEPLTILIVLDGRTLASLGRIAPGRALPDPLTFKLGKTECDLLLGGRAGFEVLLQSPAGRIALRRALQLEVTGRPAGT